MGVCFGLITVWQGNLLLGGYGGKWQEELWNDHSCTSKDWVVPFGYWSCWSLLKTCSVHGFSCSDYLIRNYKYDTVLRFVGFVW